MSTPAPRLPLTRRTALGAAAWSAPLVVVATAAPALAASGPATAIQRFDPPAGSFSVGAGSRTVRTRLVNGSIPVAGAVVTFVLSNASFVTFTGGSTSTTAVTGADGIASVTLVPVAGASPTVGSSTTLTATHQALSVAWTVTYARIDALSSGSTGYHRLVLSGGALYAFGFNNNGQIGDRTITNRSTPVPVARTGTSIDGKTIRTAATSIGHSVAAASDGTVHAWGLNNFGQLGIGTTTNASAPVQVSTTGTLSGKTITALAVGYYYSVALASDGTVHTWGRNNAGQLGNGTTTNASAPVPVNTTGTLSGKAVTAVTAGNNHTVVLASDGTVHAWGANNAGQLGIGTSTPGSPVPVQVSAAGSMAGKSIIAVAAGLDHSVALASDGTVHAWGSNSDGQLGNGTSNNSFVPVQVNNTGTLAGKTVTAVAAAGSHSVALVSGGTVHAWGANYAGQLGNSSTTSSTVPVQVITAGTPMNGRTITAVAAGWEQTYAVSSDQLGFSWGSCYVGELGNGTSSQSSVPTQIAAVPAGQAARVARRTLPRSAVPRPAR